MIRSFLRRKGIRNKAHFQPMLLTQIGVPAEAVAIVIGTGLLFGMFIAMCNCLGDVVAATVTAESEKLMDMQAYLKD